MIENEQEYNVDSLPLSRLTSETAEIAQAVSYVDLIKSVTTNGSYSEMLHVYGLSSAIRMPVISYCPPSEQPDYPHLYTRSIRGRNVELSPIALTIMWTTVRFPQDRNAFRNANHIIYLEPLSSCTESQQSGDSTDLKPPLSTPPLYTPRLSMPLLADHVDEVVSTEIDEQAQSPQLSKKSVVTKGRKFQCSWITKFTWLKYSEHEEKVFCENCLTCDKNNLFSFSTKRDEAFITQGFQSWRNALAKFKSHELSKCHTEAVMKLAVSRKGTNVLSELSTAHTRDRIAARTALHKVVSSIQFLAKQGLAMRGHTDDSANFNNLLELRATDCEPLRSWLNRSGYKWTSHDIQNEVLQELAHSVLRTFSKELLAAKYYAIIMDEASDISVKEQVSICFRYVLPDLEVHETFMGFYETAATDAGSLFTIINDSLVRFNMKLDNCRGQCFDGASNMAGTLSGLQRRISDIQPKAVHMHCMNHCLSLSFQDAIAAISQCRDAMNQVKDLVNFVRESPKRLAWFTGFQSTGAPALRPLCPTRWTMRVSSIESVCSNYNELLDFLQEMSDADRSEMGAKSSGYLKQLKTFSMFFSLKLLFIVFSTSESAAKSLQSPKLSLTKAHGIITALSVIWQNMRCDSRYEEFWSKLTSEADILGIDIPVLPRARKIPRRLDGGPSQQHTHSSVEDFYRQIYFTAIDAALMCLKTRFESPPFAVACKIEELVLSFINSPTAHQPNIKCIIDAFGNDLNEPRLQLHLNMLGDLCRSNIPSPRTVTCIGDVIELLQKNDCWRDMLPEVVEFLRLFLTLPVTTCTAERSFSCLRRLKTFLRSTMNQERLNHVAVLHCHRERTEAVDITSVCNTFIAKNEMRSRVFATFPI